MIVQVIFWASIAWLAYVFVGYPVGCAVVARLRPRPLKPKDQPLPSVTFVMAAFNEESLIEGRIKNHQRLDYPPELLSFAIGSDGSTDRTDQIIESAIEGDTQITLQRFNRQGKTRIVYTLAEESDSDIIVFTDADVLLKPDAVRLIAECFADETVGGVVGNVRYRDSSKSAGGSGERKFVEIESILRHSESLIWTTVAPTGQCIAVRRGAYTPLSDYRLSDDLNLCITIPINGYRVWYEPKLDILEINKRTLESEFSRRVRMGQQSTATYLAFPQTRYPWASWIGFQIWSHKLLRNLAAIPALLVVLTVLLLFQSSPIYTAIALGCAIWLSALLLGWVIDHFNFKVPLLAYPLYFSAMVLSLTLGSVRAPFAGGLELWRSPRLQ